ncbi:MAG: ADOP family duplicated permease [Acidobacteriota bacterium]
MPPRTVPPQLCALLLRLVVDPADRDAVLGDLTDELQQRATREGPRRARRWYRRQALRSLWPAAARRWLDARGPSAPRLPADRKKAHAMDKPLRDLRHAARALAHSPGFTVITVLALTLGIGASTSVFSVVDALWLSPLPYPDANRLVMLWEVSNGGGGGISTPAPANFFDWKEQSETLTDMAAFVSDNLVLTGVDEPERLDGYRVGSGFFDVLGVGAVAGRTLRAEENVPGGEHVVVISHALWQRRFGGHDSFVDDTLRLGGLPYRVVGVMPADFEFPAAGVDYWRPMAMDAEEAGQRTSHYISVIGRLPPTTTLATTRAELDAIAARLEAQYPDANEDSGILVRPLREEIVGDSRPLLLAAGGAVALVLVIACANVASLMLARAAARDDEVAVRAALGASGVEIARQFFAEALLVAGLGALGGLIFSLYGVGLLKVLAPADAPVLGQIGINGNALWFSSAIAATTALLSGLAPALHAARRPPGEALRAGSRTSSAGRARLRLRAALVTVEIALALTLLVGAGLLLRSFVALNTVEPGFDAQQLLSVRFDFSGQRYVEYDGRMAFYDQLLERLQATPGVESAGMITMLPMTFTGGSTSVSAEGDVRSADDDPIYPLFRIVSPGYLRTMQIPLRGRDFRATDRADSEPVAIVNQAFARRFWGTADVLGERIKIGRPQSSEPWLTIIAVADNVRQFGMETEPRPEFYISYKQSGNRGFFLPRDLVLRSTGDPYAQVVALRATVRAIDPDMPLSEIRSGEDIVAGSVAQRRFNMLLIGGFAAAALLLAALGVYGVVSHAVASRTREIGVRMALGADRGAVLRMVIRQGALMIGAGAALGLAGALAAARLVEALLYRVSPFDPATFAAVGALLVVVASIAVLVPARRALRVDPIVALQSS